MCISLRGIIISLRSHHASFPLANVGASPLSLVARLSQSSNLTTASAEVVVVGGEEVELGEVPYMVSLQDVRWTPTQPRHYCGGAIYDASTVITAAHCVNSFTKDYFGVTSLVVLVFQWVFFHAIRSDNACSKVFQPFQVLD